MMEGRVTNNLHPTLYLQMRINTAETAETKNTNMAYAHSDRLIAASEGTFMQKSLFIYKTKARCSAMKYVYKYSSITHVRS